MNDPAFNSADWQTIKAAVPQNDEGSMIVLVADSITMGSDDHPILVVDLMDFEGEPSTDPPTAA